MAIKTELTDITFKAGTGSEISLSSFGLHVENQGINSMFMLPNYSNIKSVDWQEYNGEDVDFSTASVDPLDLQIKVFGEHEQINALLAQLETITKAKDINVKFCITEGRFSNAITFSTKFSKAVKSKAIIENEWRLEYFMLTDEDSDKITTEADSILLAGVDVKRWRGISFVSLHFTRHDNKQYFGLLEDNTKQCEGIPTNQFHTSKFPVTNMPFEFQRYSITDRTATLVDTFNMYNNLVFCYPLKGFVQGITTIAESKDPFVIQTENMIGEHLETRNADRHKSKQISIPLLVRSHSVSAIFHFFGQYKTFIHETLTEGDMLYLHSDTFGDMAVYPSGCSVTKAYIKDMPWIEMTLNFVAYKDGFDFTATTDNEANDNPDPVLPPAPSIGFDPYSGITKSSWTVCNYGSNVNNTDYNVPFLVTPNSNSTNAVQTPFGTYDSMVKASLGWSIYSLFIDRYPVGTLFFAVKNTRTENGILFVRYSTLVCMPFCVSNLEAVLDRYAQASTISLMEETKFTLVGVVQGCDVLSKNIHNWESELQDAPKYGGMVGGGSVRVHSSVYALRNKFNVANGLTLTTSDDFDTLINNLVEDYADDPANSGYYNESGYKNSQK